MSRQERRRAGREAARVPERPTERPVEAPGEEKSAQERVRMLDDATLVAEARKVAGWMMDGGGPWAGSVLEEVALRFERASAWADHWEHAMRTFHLGGGEPDARMVLWCDTCDEEAASVPKAG